MLFFSGTSRRESNGAVWMVISANRWRKLEPPVVVYGSAGSTRSRQFDAVKTPV
jgi:hypothetical protein